MSSPRSIMSTVGWGLFCACSWTWCIGMFLPVIMIDRFGWPGFIAFAIPNVLGCTAFGYVLKTKARSESLVSGHRAVMVCFSLVAIAFHLFFISLCGFLLKQEGYLNQVGFVLLPFCLVAVSLPFTVKMRFEKPHFMIGILCLYGLSMLIFASIGFDKLTLVPMTGLLDGTQLIWLTPVLFFGFLLCPYFDLTFHRALQNTPSRHAFLVFGLTFSVLILMTCAYWYDIRWLGNMVFFHIFFQSAFTIGVHTRGIWTTATGMQPRHRAALLALPLLGILPGLAVLWNDDAREAITRFDGAYLRFLVFFGLIFPAWAIVFMNPWWAPRRSKKSVAIFAITALAAAPFYELGFIREQMWALSVPMLAAVGWIVFTIRRGAR